MDAPQITDALDRLQTLFTPADDAMVDLSNLVGGHDGSLFNAINALQDALLHDLAQSIGCTRALLVDWWVTHEWGSNPMVVYIDYGPAQRINSNAGLAAFLAEVCA